MLSLLRNDQSRPFIGGHRGARSKAPDNTWDGFEAGLASGADLIECDVQILSSNQPVLFHGFYFNDIDGEKKWIWNLSQAEAKSILGDKFILLEDLLDWAKNRIKLALDIKVGFDFGLPIAESIVSSIHKTNSVNNVFLISWTHDTLYKAKTIEPDVAIAPLLYCRPANPIAYAQSINANALFMRRPQIDKKLIEDAHSQGIAISPIDIFNHTSENYKELAEMGIDIMIVDDPEFAVQCFS